MTGVKSAYFKPAYRAVLTGTDGSLQKSSSRSYTNYPNHAEKTRVMWQSLLDYFLEQFPEAQVLFHQPWTYQAVEYGKEDVTMTPELQASNEDKIEYFVKEICSHYNTEAETLVQRVDTGRAWQILRNPEHEYGIGYDYLCCRLDKSSGKGDGYHDGDIGGGQYLNACVWFEVVTGISVLGNPYRPDYATSYTLSTELFDKLHVEKTSKGYALTQDFTTALQQYAHDAVAELGLTIVDGNYQ